MDVSCTLWAGIKRRLIAAVEEFKAEMALDPANAMAKAVLAHAYVKTRESGQTIELLSQLLRVIRPTFEPTLIWAMPGNKSGNLLRPSRRRARACMRRQPEQLALQAVSTLWQGGRGCPRSISSDGFQSRRGAEKQGISGGNCRLEVKGPAGGARILIVA